MFLSLLMALAYTLQTRVDLCVYVNALQRHAQTPTCLHVRRLNAVVRWAQRNPLALHYKRMSEANQLVIHSDAGFRKEEKDCVDVGRAVRGANYIRTGKDAHGLPTAHLLHWDCSAIKTVTRSTFTSELQAAIAATDSGLLLAVGLHELANGAVTAAEGRKLREEGGLKVNTVVCIDAMSIFSALAAERVKAPAEKSMLLHLLWLRELLEKGILNALHWLDTRAMSADGHTKGSIERDTLRELASGVMPKVGADMVKVLKWKNDQPAQTPKPERQLQHAAGQKRSQKVCFTEEGTEKAQHTQCLYGAPPGINPLRSGGNNKVTADSLYRPPPGINPPRSGGNNKVVADSLCRTPSGINPPCI